MLVQFSLPICPTLAIPWTAAHQASLSITNSWSLLKLMSIESLMPFNYLILCCPLLLLPSIFPSIKALSNELALRIRWLKYWNFSFISLSMNIQDWFPLGLTGLISLKSKVFSSLFQYHSSRAAILGTQLSSWSSSHIHTWLLEKP